MDSWFVPFTKEIGLPAMLALTFIWYFVRVFFPEQKNMMIESIKVVSDSVKTISTQYEKNIASQQVQYEKNLSKIQEFNERMLKEIMNNNLQVHENINKRIDGVVSEIIEFREEISKKLDDATGKFYTHK